MAKTVRARVLVDVEIEGKKYVCGRHVVEIDGDVAKSFVKDGALDTSAAAVKYALEEGGAEVVVHTSARQSAADERAAQVAEIEAALAAADDADKPALQAQLDALK